MVGQQCIQIRECSTSERNGPDASRKMSRMNFGHDRVSHRIRLRAEERPPGMAKQFSYVGNDHTTKKPTQQLFREKRCSIQVVDQLPQFKAQFSWQRRRGAHRAARTRKIVDRRCLNTCPAEEICPTCRSTSGPVPPRRPGPFRSEREPGSVADAIEALGDRAVVAVSHDVGDLGPASDRKLRRVAPL